MQINAETQCKLIHIFFKSESKKKIEFSSNYFIVQILKT